MFKREQVEVTEVLNTDDKIVSKIDVWVSENAYTIHDLDEEVFAFLNYKHREMFNNKYEKYDEVLYCTMKIKVIIHEDNLKIEKPNQYEYMILQNGLIMKYECDYFSYNYDMSCMVAVYSFNGAYKINRDKIDLYRMVYGRDYSTVEKEDIDRMISDSTFIEWDNIKIKDVLNY